MVWHSFGNMDFSMYNASSVQAALSASGQGEKFVSQFMKELNMLEKTLREQRTAAAILLNFGKHKGKTLDQIYEEDPQYIVNYLAKNEFVQTQTTRLRDAVNEIAQNHR